MRILKRHYGITTTLLFMLALVLTGCSSGNGGSTASGDTQTDVFAVTSVSPVDGATGVPTNTMVVAAFNKPVDASTIDTFNFTVGVVGEASVPGTVVYDEATNTAIFTPAMNNDFAPDSTHRATLTTAVKDQSGKSLAQAYVWDFTTGTGPDNTPPTLQSTNPDDGATEVRRNQTIRATFDQAIDPTTINSDNFYLNVSGGGASIPGDISYVPETYTAFFKPSTDLEANQNYTVTLTSGVQDATRDGNPLVETTWSFQTGDRFISAPVTLGTAGNYVILAKAGISTTGETDIWGDIAVSPAAESYITGFSQSRDSTNEFSTSAIVTGRIFAADMASPTPANLTTAVGDMETAYNDAAGRSNPDQTELGAGNIGGMTLVPGLYNWSTSLLIDTNVTLSGDANDVWIFQIAQNLTVSSGVIVNLSGGALPQNIFWQVAEQVTLGTTADFKGIILSKTDIVMNNNAKLHGRAFAQTAVTLDANEVTEPAE